MSSLPDATLFSSRSKYLEDIFKKYKFDEKQFINEVNAELPTIKAYVDNKLKLNANEKETNILNSMSLNYSYLSGLINVHHVPQVSIKTISNAVLDLFTDTSTIKLRTFFYKARYLIRWNSLHLAEHDYYYCHGKAFYILFELLGKMQNTSNLETLCEIKLLHKHMNDIYTFAGGISDIYIRGLQSLSKRNAEDFNNVYVNFIEIRARAHYALLNICIAFYSDGSYPDILPVYCLLHIIDMFEYDLFNDGLFNSKVVEYRMMTRFEKIQIIESVRNKAIVLTNKN